MRLSRENEWLLPEYVKTLQSVKFQLHASICAVLATSLTVTYYSDRSQWRPSRLRFERAVQTFIIVVRLESSILRCQESARSLKGLYLNRLDFVLLSHIASQWRDAKREIVHQRKANSFKCSNSFLSFHLLMVGRRTVI